MKKWDSRTAIQIPLPILQRLGVIRLGEMFAKWLQVPLSHVFVLLGVIALSIILNSLIWAVALWFFPSDSPAAILHYTTDLGVDFVGSGTQIYTLPRLGTFILLFNIIIGLAVCRADNRAAWQAWSITPAIQLILLAAALLVRNANI